MIFARIHSPGWRLASSAVRQPNSLSTCLVTPALDAIDFEHAFGQ